MPAIIVLMLFLSIIKFYIISKYFVFQVFPFSIVFDNTMKITHIGDALTELFCVGDLIGQKVNEMFQLRRPLNDFTWENVTMNFLFDQRAISVTNNLNTSL